MEQNAIPQKKEAPKQRKGYPQIKKWLPWGAQKKIAEELGVSKGNVSAVLRGEYFRRPIFEALVREATKAKREYMELQEKDKELLQFLES